MRTIEQIKQWIFGESDHAPRTQMVDENGENVSKEGNVNVKQVSSVATGYESVSVSNSVAALTSGTYGVSTIALITVEGAEIRFRIDGDDPTATEGHILSPSDMLELNSNEDINNFKAIRAADTDATIRITYSEEG